MHREKIASQTKSNLLAGLRTAGRHRLRLDGVRCDGRDVSSAHTEPGTPAVTISAHETAGDVDGQVFEPGKKRPALQTDKSKISLTTRPPPV
jgi:hypothetical protein